MWYLPFCPWLWFRCCLCLTSPNPNSNQALCFFVQCYVFFRKCNATCWNLWKSYFLFHIWFTKMSYFLFVSFFLSSAPHSWSSRTSKSYFFLSSILPQLLVMLNVSLVEFFTGFIFSIVNNIDHFFSTQGRKIRANYTLVNSSK